ncbi:hypothetical protein [Providencia hangzhouensis]
MSLYCLFIRLGKSPMQQRIEDKFTQAHSAREEHSVGEFILAVLYWGR